MTCRYLNVRQANYEYSLTHWRTFSRADSGLVPLHKNYDYCSFFEDAGLELEHVEYFRFAKKGPVFFQSIIGRKPALSEMPQPSLGGESS